MSIFIIFLLLLVISPRLPSRSSPNLPGKWKIVCNRKVTLLVSEFFREWGGVGSERSLILWTQLHKIQRGSKTNLLIKKESCLILAG